MPKSIFPFYNNQQRFFRCVLLFLFLLLSKSNYAQITYKGKLISALTNKPIKGALIEMNGNIVAGSDSLGFFSFESDSVRSVTLTFETVEVGGMIISGFRFKKDEVLLIKLEPDCQFSYRKDIAAGKPKLLMIFSAFAPRLTKKDHAFAKKYHLTYQGYGDGCTGIVTDCIDTYNKAVGLYLDKKYGKKWRKEVSGDVSGL